MWRPDITIVKGNHCTLIEATCLYRISTTYLNQRSEEKKQKHERLIKKELNQTECTTGEVISLVIGALVTIREITN